MNKMRPVFHNRNTIVLKGFGPYSHTISRCMDFGSFKFTDRLPLMYLWVAKKKLHVFVNIFICIYFWGFWPIGKMYLLWKRNFPTITRNQLKTLLNNLRHLAMEWREVIISIWQKSSNHNTFLVCTLKNCKNLLKYLY